MVQQAYPAPEMSIQHDLEGLHLSGPDREWDSARDLDDLNMENPNSCRYVCESPLSMSQNLPDPRLEHEYNQPTPPSLAWDQGSDQASARPNHQRNLLPVPEGDYSNNYQTQLNMYQGQYQPQADNARVPWSGDQESYQPTQSSFPSSGQPHFSNAVPSCQPSSYSRNTTLYKDAEDEGFAPIVDQMPNHDTVHRATKRYYSQKDNAAHFDNDGMDSRSVSEVSSDFMHSRPNSPVTDNAHDAFIEPSRPWQALLQ